MIYIKIIFIKLYENRLITLFKGNFPIDNNQVIYEELKYYASISNKKNNLKEGVIKW